MSVDYIERARALDRQIHNLKSRQVSDQERIETIASVLSQVANQKSIALIQAARELAIDAYARPEYRERSMAVLRIVGDRL